MELEIGTRLEQLIKLALYLYFFKEVLIACLLGVAKAILETVLKLKK